MRTPDTIWHAAIIRRVHRQSQNGHGTAILWFSGLRCAGKSTLARK